MTDKIGVLGEQTGISVATHTVYTVPTGKAAKCKIMFYGQAATGGCDVTVNVNAIPVMKTGALTDSDYMFTSTENMLETASVVPSGAAKETTVAPAPQEYYLSAGDIVTYSIATRAMTSLNVQVVGAELDV